MPALPAYINRQVFAIICAVLNTQSLSYSLLATLLRLALLAALIGAGWNIYHNLPAGGVVSGENVAEQTALQIVLRPSARDQGAAINVPVQLYPVDVGAVQREFGFEPHPGVHFEDFLKDRMQGRAPVKARLDENGRATVMVTPGQWWVHAMLAGSQTVEWRLPVRVSGRQQLVELNADNIYARTKSF
ncbi:MAG: hypothetical protein QOJ64_609 [Acidobacteriota bacterium]|jgi:hypothetical protein|nr:hypothetical protein [Acidobacteriota bacterium]